MSLKTGTLLKSRSSIVCPQTTQFAILLICLREARKRHGIHRSAMGTKEGPTFGHWSQ